jgi:hypothetical protein
MLTATTSPPLAYLMEPFSREHRPGVLDTSFPYWFPYICHENGAPYVDSVRDMLALRYNVWPEVRAIRTPKDVGRLGRDWARFRGYRKANAVPLLKDPIAVLSSDWLCDTFDMNVVVLARHPAAFAHSLKRRGWDHPFEDFLRQPLLMRDLLSPFESEIRTHTNERQPILDQAVLLWKILYSVVAQFGDRRPDWVFLRLEDVARDPVSVFADLFRRLGLTFDEGVQKTIRDHSDPSNPIQDANPTSVRRNSAASIVTWKTGLTQEEIERVRTSVEHVSNRWYSDSDW